MLSLYEQRTGQVTPVSPARRGQLTAYTAGLAGGEPAGPGDLRRFLVADIISRFSELRGLVVTCWQSDPGEAAQALEGEFAALNIHPVPVAAGPPEPLDIGIAGPGADPPAADGQARWLLPGPVLTGDGPLGTGDGGPVAAVLAGAGLDPLAFRLALLRQRYREPAAMAGADLAAAEGLLRQWRKGVAVWADSPSKPMCPQYLAGIAAALDDDLDTPAALAWLARLAADAEIPAGAKFETFAYADRLLGLDLAREIGR